jgi:hypothetical protein
MRERISNAVQTAIYWAGSGLTSTLAVVVVLAWLILGIPWGFPNSGICGRTPSPLWSLFPPLWSNWDELDELLRVN